ncbi:MAG: T9SS type A sorting domain-containing protein [Saprospiraceae bacterium]|nr:T9SS type A sorting domain-containing protein [Saprospiraceae bacterium]
MKVRQTLFFSLIISLSFSMQAQDHPQVPYGPEDRQFVDIFIAPSECPTPVYFDAHGNGGNTNIPNSIVDDLKAVGISIVAWESLTSVGTPAEVQIGWDDAELMFAWVKANADTYNFDTTNFIIGGSSRGSILSWKYGHAPNPNIKGLYMYNALPNGVWADSSWWYPPNEVNISSPPIFFVYRYEPGVDFDSHDPANGIIIMDKYEELGIGDRDTLIHSIQYTDNNDKYQFLVDFAVSVVSTCQVVRSPLVASESSNYMAFPNPFHDQLQIAGLKGGEQLILSSSNGAVMQETDDLKTLNVSTLHPGLYFLTIQTRNSRKTLKLMKH